MLAKRAEERLALFGQWRHDRFAQMAVTRRRCAVRCRRIATPLCIRTAVLCRCSLRLRLCPRDSAEADSASRIGSVVSMHINRGEPLLAIASALSSGCAAANHSETRCVHARCIRTADGHAVTRRDLIQRVSAIDESVKRTTPPRIHRSALLLFLPCSLSLSLACLLSLSSEPH